MSKKVETEGYQRFLEQMAMSCHCQHPYPCPCDGVLNGGMCDEMGHEPDFSKDDEELEDE